MSMHAPNSMQGDSSGNKSPIVDNNTTSLQDLARIWEWNRFIPQTVDGCVHDLITDMANLQPDAQAVCAWDGEWTYRHLDEMTTHLAKRLVHMGVGPNTIIPLCFEKSKWTPVAMLAVMKAGGTSVALETTLPHDRLRSIVQQVDPIVVLSSSLSSQLADRLTMGPVMIVDDMTTAEITGTCITLPEVQPWNGLYIIFTSGSTGTPKGTTITHSNFRSAIHHQLVISGFSRSSRVYDFAKYSFDVTWSNFIFSMVSGGCLCIPSQEEALNNITGSFLAYNANCLDITPSIGSMLRPSDFNGTLEVVLFAGEALSSSLASQWADHARVINLYGPAECTVSTIAEIQRGVSTGSPTASIGRGAGLCTWVVDKSCHDTLVPVGDIGELILEGPLVGGGYIGDVEKTASVFIEDPKWLVAGAPGHEGRRGRVYKTGDLVRYGEDGSLTFIGRKDSQVKINGQRVELGDIEHNVRTHIADDADMQVVAQLVTPRDASKAMLVAFVQITTEEARESKQDLESELKRVIHDIDHRLAVYLPAYMIPSAYIPIAAFPITSSGKVDKRKLKQLAESLSTQELTDRGSPALEKREPTTPTESRLRELWSSVLCLAVDAIGSDDGFFRLGGDSMAAMKLVVVAREHGMSLSVADIFNQPVLSDMTAVVKEALEATSVVEPFSLLENHLDVESVKSQTSQACGVESDAIEDVFPCTPLQEGLLALTAKHPGDYVSRHIFQLQPTTDMGRLKSSWDHIVAENPILRTLIVDLNQQGLVQVVVNQSAMWTCAEGTMSLLEFREADAKLTTGLGTPLSRFALFDEPVEDETRRFFVWTIHHALYDGWSKPLLMRQLEDAYDGRPLRSSPPFQDFVNHIAKVQKDEAHRFWSAQFEESEAQIFPPLPSPKYEARSDRLKMYKISGLLWPQNMGVTASITLRAAWSIIIACYTNADDTVFGVTVSGRQAAVRGVEQMTGPTIATVPVRITLEKSKTVEELLLQVQAQAVDMIPFEQTGLQVIRRVSAHTERACNFQTLLVVQPAVDEEKDISGRLFMNDGVQFNETDVDMDEFRTYPLSLECHLEDQGVVVSTRFDSAVLNEEQVSILMRQLEHIIRQLCDPNSAKMKLEDVALVGQQDLEQIWSWNSIVPETADGVVHDLIATATIQQPEAQAICSWDGNWTYRELDGLSTKLAHHLVELGVGPEVIVPICIEKSKWMPVAMMAVLKAGGASVAIDYAQPEHRLRIIVKQVSPIVMLTSVANQDLARRLTPHHPVVIVGEQQTTNLIVSASAQSRGLPIVQPFNKLYVVFTSGSTGAPKGVVVTHANITSAIKHQRETLGFTKYSRVYDFASYMFDVVWCNLLQGLSAGGCICIPSNDDRSNDPLGAFARLEANTVIFTPSTIRGLDMRSLKGLRHIHYIGEALSREDFIGFPPDVVVTNLYGPTECTTFSTAQLCSRTSDERISIGTGFGLRTWLVHPSNHSKLVPIGCCGELVLDGPLVAAGYLGDEANTAASFIDNPTWLLDGSTKRAGRRGRVYKTGDLALYNTDGSLLFLGRKDSQVKINGQRVELGDIEHHIQSSIPLSDDATVIAEVVMPIGSNNAMLVAFVVINDASSSDDSEAMRNKVQSLTDGLSDRLLSQVPAYMVPSAYIPLDKIPLTPTGKIDRRELRNMGQQLSLHDLARPEFSSSKHRRPSTAVEKGLQHLWAAVLGLDAEEISAGDSFLHIGGDSITAMRLVTAARKQQIDISVADIFKHPVLHDLATLCEGLEGVNNSDSNSPIESFSLLSQESLEGLKDQIAKTCNVDATEVADAFPCTPLQEGLLALTAKRAGDYVARFVYPLLPDIASEHFFAAWEAVVSVTPILRTRIVDLGERGLVQAVINQATIWTYQDEKITLEVYQKADRQLTTGLGTPLSRVAVIRDPDSDNRLFVWTIHHALYDGWSIPLILERLEAAYDWSNGGIAPPSPSFQSFVKHVTNMDQKVAAKYWAEQFRGSEAQTFPSLSSATYQPMSNAFIKHRIRDLQWPKNNVTPAMIVRAAWALLASQYTGCDETIFGVTVSGRQASVPGVDRIIGPTIATVPVRITTKPEEMTVYQLLHKIQTQAVEMTDFEQTGLQRIRRVSPEAQRACEFQTLLVVHPAEEEEKASHWFIGRRDENGEDDTNVTEHDTHALTIECNLEQQGLRMRIAYDANILSIEKVRRLAHQLEHAVRQISVPENANKCLENLDMVSPQDMQKLWEWNGTCPEALESCLHEMISETAKIYPDALAINSWDGEFTYREFDELSTRLAYHLVGIGVSTDSVIPLYFEKSKWAPITMLAVMKAGGAPVMMDSRQPPGRLRAIIHQIDPVAIAASVSNEELTRKLTKAPIAVISDRLLEELSHQGPIQRLPQVQPWNKAYLIFTSGSTGVPKGAILTHANVCSAVRYQSVAHGYTRDARVYDFTSYAFDTAWNNFMHTFTIGACLCIPSESERRDDLAGSINRFNCTILDITPSAATALQISTIKSLRTLILGGERLSSEYARRWGAIVDLKLPYGPCECTPTATIATIDSSVDGEPSIGHGIGLITWVVDTKTGNRLLPIGATGELVLEGPLVGLGYLGDEEKTMAAFTQSPPWLLRGGAGWPGREGRLYKTGDLVRYNPDGSLMFVERKDAQVKVNGQRVELGEIESHMLRHPQTRQSIALYPRTGPCAKKLVGIFSRGAKQQAESQPCIELVGTENETDVQEHIQTLQALLGETLPTYMIPSIWIALKDVPLNPSGKLNRRLVEDWLLSMDPETFAKIHNTGSGVPAREPQTDSERIIRDACGVILNIPPAEVNLECSFVTNGGDSISAMRLAPYCRAANLIFSVAALLKCKTLANVAAQSSFAAHGSTVDFAEDFGKAFALSPIQKWFFAQSHSKTFDDKDSYCNQGFYVKVNRHVLNEEVSVAIRKIVQHHSMLRARFGRSGSGWVQTVPSPAEAVFHFSYADAQSVNEIKANVSKSHQNLNIQNGLVFAADLYTLPCRAQYLTLVAHHLVVDLVSWRIILDDLEALLNGQELLDSLPFQIWNNLQIKEAQSSKYEPEKVLSTEDVHNNLDFWNFNDDTPNTTKNHIERSLHINNSTTSLLLKESNAAFNTEPVDLILSAVWHAFFRTFPMRQGLTIFNEGHGRESWSSEIDPSRTVGWFTTMSPIHVTRSIRDSDSAANIVRFVKDARRRLPSNGWAYWVSRYMNERGIKAFDSHATTMEVQFNYHGQFQQLERSDSLFDVVNFDDSISAVGPSLPTSVLFDINVVIETGVTKISFAWNRYLAHQGLIRDWVVQIGTSLQSICIELSNKRPERTLCDYEFLSIPSYKALDELHTEVLYKIEKLNDTQVEGIYPCSPMVDGILLSQIKGTGSYETSQTWDIRPQGSHVINIQALTDAWQAVIARHPSLRTVFIQGMDGSVAFNSVVLKSCRGHVVHIEGDSFTSAVSLLKELPKAIYRQTRPSHRLVLCHIVRENRLLCQIEMNHAICDGASTAITMKDWAKAYSEDLDIQELQETSHGFALALKSVSKADKMAYWANKLSGMEPCHFPRFTEAAMLPLDEKITGTVTLELTGERFKLMQQFCEAQSITPASLFHTAWALTLSAYTSSNSVCFAYLASGRDLPVKGLMEAAGAFANIMICRADISEEWSGNELISHLHNQVLEDLSFQHCSIADIQHTLGLPFGQALFNTIMSFQKDDDSLSEGIETQDLIFVDLDWEDPTEYDVTINVRYTSTFVCFTLDHRLVRLSKEQALRVISLLETVVMSLITEDKLGPTATRRTSRQLSRMNDISEMDLQDIWKWNMMVPETVDGLVHDIIADVVQKTPDAPAVCAWDGDFTYAELDAITTKLAHHLVSKGLGTDDIVPLCFEKSKWMPVAILAVMKAGAASVALDTTLPEDRLRSIICQVEPKMILASHAREEMTKRLTRTVAVPVTAALIANIDKLSDAQTLPEIKPWNKLYVVFTSGSTGAPKGVIITHSNFSSAIRHQQAALGFKRTSRVYDFAKYAFDVTWSNFLHTMTAGACLCIPSEAEASNDVTGSLVLYNANFVDLTPSVASTLHPGDLTTLEQLLFSGEALTTHLAAQWAEQATVLNTYGPAECSVKATFAAVGKANTSASSIGLGVGMCTWIVQPTNHNKLVPIGCVGELLLEGPLVGAGYLGDPEKTKAAFIEDPAWLLRGGPGTAGRSGRLYKTGDIVRYNTDGSITFVGRKDDQIKISGQRLELGDVEHHIRTNIAHDAELQVFADVIQPRESNKSILVGFIYGGDEATGLLTEKLRDITNSLNEKLATQVPAYMIPSAYILLDKLPMTATGKTDRRHIRKTGRGLTFEEVMALNSPNGDYKPPSTPSERLMQRLWASVLGIMLDRISADASFLRVGGDSIGAMKLVGAAREAGLALTVTDIFQRPKLSDMARAVGRVSSDNEDTTEPFSLLNTSIDHQTARKEAAAVCHIDATQIEDIFPCTPLQEGLLALTAKRAGDYVAQYILPLQETVDLVRFKEAWARVLQTTPILRTRIVDLESQGLVQVVVKQGTSWPQCSGPVEWQERGSKLTMGMGDPLVHYSISDATDDEQHFFMWTVHHALYDGWSMPRIMDRLETAYRDKTLVQETPPFQRFVQYIMKVDKEESKRYWQGQFEGSEAQSFPTLPSHMYQPTSNASITHSINNLHWPRNEITASTAIRTAWAILTARYTNSSDVVFGVTVSGRHAAVHEVDKMIGPTLATVPVRVAFEWEQPVETLLHQVQKQMVEMTAFEQTGLQQIRQMGAEARQACEFQTLILIHPPTDASQPKSQLFASKGQADIAEGEVPFAEFDTHAITIECDLKRSGVEIRFEFDESIIGYSKIQRLGKQMENVLKQLCDAGRPSKQIADVETVCKADLDLVWKWNATVPETIQTPVHDMVTSTCRKVPNSPAICAWDGNWSYGQLDEISSRLAQYLVHLGIGPEVIVPLLFEKSRWTPVAVLGVMKAGGACITVDSNLPEYRIASIVEQVQPMLILSSPSNKELAANLSGGKPIIVVNMELLASLQIAELQPLPTVGPGSTVYINFTSGSTGTPKGVRILHSNFSSALRHQHGAHNFEAGARVYDFASYAFDTSWQNLFSTLECGACLCIPSEDERRDDLAASFKRYEITHSEITPSAALVLPLSTIKKLDTLILGGEKIAEEHAKNWAPYVRLKNSYGPCECTPTSTVADIGPTNFNVACIGTGKGVNTWIVDTVTNNSLVPVGGIGELLLEGPLVGPGYLGDLEKTASVFINNPVWLTLGAPICAGREGRLYKTGDLVHYNEDGSLIYIGRKDAQVKIHGQRVEMGDIENHIMRHDLIRQSACLIPKSGPFAKTLVGVFSVKKTQDDHKPTRSSSEENSPDLTRSPRSKSSETVSTTCYNSIEHLNPEKLKPSSSFILEDSSTALRSHIAGIQNLLDNSLPSYMVPTVWIALKDIPLNASGKLNRKQVEAWLTSLNHDTHMRIVNIDSIAAPRDPETAAEVIIRDACSMVLNVPVTEINLQRSFVTNGGDSISAMRLSPHCRAANLLFSVGTLLKAKSLAEVAKSSSVASISTIPRTEEFNKPFALSPIQQWFFDQSPAHLVNTTDYFCNQSFYVRINQAVSVKDVREAVSKVVEHHSMLRARFQQQDNSWVQVIPKPSDARYHFDAREMGSMSEVQTLVARRHQELDFENGLVFSADLCELASSPRQQYLILIAHHLVIDLVSWRIILDDLESLLTGGSLMEILPFQVWNELQHREAASARLDPENALPTHGSRNDLGFWGFNPGISNTTHDHLGKTMIIGEDTTQLVLKEANNAFDTDPVDVLLSAVWDAFLKIYPSRDGLTIFNEGHGREPWDSDIDLARTVGWFTTLSPIHISRTMGHDSANIVRLVKDARRKLPSNGWAYFASRYLSKKGRETFQSDNSVMEMTFNYHGQFQQLEREDAFFESIMLEDVSDIGPRLPVSSLFTINMSIEGRHTHVSVTWNRHISHQGLIHQWVDQIGVSLESICQSLIRKPAERTLVDYEFLNLDYPSLDELQSHLIPDIQSLNATEVEGIYPCSPMVDGMLLSQLKGTGLYETSQSYEIKPRGSHRINLEQLSAAWQDVIARHPSLRSVFIESSDSSVAFNQVVLRHHHGEVILLNSGTMESAEALVKSLPKVSYQQLKPPHRVIFCQITDSKSIFCHIKMSHAITDGESTGILLGDWSKAYSGDLGGDDLGETSRGFARFLRSSNANRRKSYWKKKLNGLEPCTFPHLDKISAPTDVVSWSTIDIDGDDFSSMRRFCEARSITPASLFHAAWALTLASYTGTNSVCFGYITSGRDLPISGIEEAIGAYANMMVCRADITREWTKDRFIQYMHHQVFEDMENQHCSLADMHHDLNLASGQQLFNTIVSFQRDVEGHVDDPMRQELEFVDCDGDDPTEYDVAISITFGADRASLFANCLPSRFSNAQAHHIIVLFKTIVLNLTEENLEKSNGETLRSVATISHDDLEEIWNRNSAAPRTVDKSLPDLISATGQRHPAALVVNAWDGDWTYSELNETSTKLALHLIALGVSLDATVALYLDTSRWVPIVMLAVMKAGGAFIHLDTSKPEDWNRDIMEQSQPVLLLVSSSNEQEAAKLAECPILVIDNDILNALLAMTDEILPSLEPRNKACIAFTSDGNGTPRGTIFTHSNISSAIEHQRSILGYASDSRTYNCSNSAFSIPWIDFMYTMAAGGCLCIPSATEQKDDFAASMRHWKLTTLSTTPSQASKMQDTLIPSSLQTLILGGERVSQEQINYWAPLVDLKIVYGPCECVSIATVATASMEEYDEATIGQGVGLNTWIVDTQDGTTLVSIGSIGELVLEGPSIAVDFRQHFDKTAFVENPPWLTHGSRSSRHPGRTGLVFKTGDLVRYNRNGTLNLIGRKDAQIKMHGQHLDVDEIESHMMLSNAIHQGACFIPKSGHYANKLVGVFSLPRNSDTSSSAIELLESGKAQEIQEVIRALQAVLDNSVPAYMVPTVWVGLRAIPIDSSGKLHRTSVEDWLCHIDAKTHAMIVSNATASSPVATTIGQRVIRDACSLILNIPTIQVNLQRSFIANGGDSISAMRVSPYCRAAGIVVSVASLLRSKKLVDVADSATVIPDGSALVHSEAFDTHFPLSPIQQWFFDQSPVEKVTTPGYYCNQAFYLQTRRQVSPEEVSVAIRKIVQKHSMLRARFHYDIITKSWSQLVSKPNEGLYHFESSQVESLAIIESKISKRHTELDIERGLVFAVDMCRSQC